MCRLWVYNAEFFCGLSTPIRTSDSTDEAKFKKGLFLGHPSTHFYIVDGVYDPSSYFSIFIFEIRRVCIHILCVGN